MSSRICPLKEAALDAPNAIALETIDGQYTYADLDRLVDRRANRLYKKGIGEGDRIAIRHPTDLFWLVTLFASLRIGATFCPLHARLTPDQAEEQLQRLIPEQSDAAGSLLLFTSGTTGTPKIARVTLKNLIANAEAILPVVDLTAEDGWLLSLPLYHVSGLGIVFRSILARARIILNPASHAVTHLSYVPTQLYRSWPIYPKLKCILLGGAPIRDIPERLPIAATYGMTEMCSAVLATRRPTFKNGDLYLGFPLAKREVKLEEGELYVRGETLFHGYLGEKRPEWHPTRDLAKFDAQLGYAIVGRKDNQFISGGENIQPEEIEAELLRHPDVLEAVVVPKPDPEFGSRPVAFVRTIHLNFDPEFLRRFLLERLPKFKIPLAFHPLPPNEGDRMKPNRKKLLESIDFFPS